MILYDPVSDSIALAGLAFRGFLWSISADFLFRRWKNADRDKALNLGAVTIRMLVLIVVLPLIAVGLMFFIPYGSSAIYSPVIPVVVLSFSITLLPDIAYLNFNSRKFDA